MNIRKAEEKDIPRLLALLGQVLQIHAAVSYTHLDVYKRQCRSCVTSPRWSWQAIRWSR